MQLPFHLYNHISQNLSAENNLFRQLSFKPFFKLIKKTYFLLIIKQMYMLHCC